MRTLTKFSGLLALAWAAIPAASAAVSTPLAIRLLDTFYNLQSQQGMPISEVFNSPSGSDGRLPGGQNESGSWNLVTSNQFQGVLGFCAAPSATNHGALSISAWLQGTYSFSGQVAEAMQRPRAYSNANVVLVLRSAQVGAPYISRQIDLLFGSVIEVPETDETGISLTNVVKTSYWEAMPYGADQGTNSGYYWSPNARQVFAIQAGPIQVTWRKLTPYTADSVPTNYVNAFGAQSFQTNGSSVYLLRTVNYVAAGSAVKPPRRMYWTERNFRLSGKPINVPPSRVGSINVVYNSNFPRTVDEEYHGPGYTSPTEGTTNAVLTELRTLWYDQSLGSIYAYNFEGRVFVEILGDLKPDGQSRAHLGFEIVDVAKQPEPADVTTDLGEQLLPPDPTDASVLYPEPLNSLDNLSFAYAQYRAGSDRATLYATRETQHDNDYSVYWMYAGVAGLRWPEQFARYHMVWPAEAGKYSHYMRTLVDTEQAAMATAVALSSKNVPSIEYQDPLDCPRAKLTDDFRFYTWLDLEHPAQRALLRFMSGENVAFERVFSWLDSNLTTTNLSGTVAANLSDVAAYYNQSAASVAYTNYLVQSAAYQNKYAPYGAYLQALANWESRANAYTNYLVLKSAYDTQLATYTTYTNWQARYTAYTNYVAYASSLAAYNTYTNWQARYTAYTNYTVYTNQLAIYRTYTNWQARFTAYTNYLALSAAYTNQFR